VEKGFFIWNQMDLGWLNGMSAPSADWGADGSARPSLPPLAVVGRVWLSAPGLVVALELDPSDQ